ncbi:MAG: SLC13 family permease [Candidatus Methanodesulfokora sp.]|jgi:Na+/H+ antiporter NhaD/arsenite permease-like protein
MIFELALVLLIFSLSSLFPEDRTVLSLIGAMAMAYVFKLLQPSDLFSSTLLRVIIAQFGLMTIASLLREGRFYSYILARFSRNRFFFPAVLLVTALLSASAGKCTVIFIVSATTFIAKECNFNPKKLIVAELIVSNLAGASMMSGSASSLLLGAWFSFSFSSFLERVGWIVLILVLLLLPLFRGERVSPAHIPLENRVLAATGILLLILVVALSLLGLDLPTVAGLLALSAFALGGKRTEAVLSDVDWSSFLYSGGTVLMAIGLSRSDVPLFLRELVGILPLDRDISVFLSAFLLSILIDDLQVIALLISAVDEGSAWSLLLGASIGSAISPIGSIATVESLSIARASGIDIKWRDLIRSSILLSPFAILSGLLWG